VRIDVPIQPLCAAGFAFLLGLPGAWGQTLQMQPQTVAPGEWVTLDIRYQSPAGREFVALQWDVEIPSAPLDPQNRPVTRAPLAIKDAGKSSACGLTKKTTDNSLVPCLLAGSSKPIPTGTVLLFSLKISDQAQPGTLHVRILNGIAVDPDLKQTPIEPVDAVVTIRPR